MIERKRPAKPKKPRKTKVAGQRAVTGDSMDGAVVITGDNNTVQLAAAPTGAALRDAYLHHVLHCAGRLSLTGVDRKAASVNADGLALQEVYTALLVLGSEENERAAGRADPQLFERASRGSSAVDKLDRHPHLVLLGEPGGGKTSFLNFVALCLAGEGLKHERANLRALTVPLPPDGSERSENEKPKRQPWHHGALLPVRVVLRDFAARGLPPVGQPARAEHLWRFIEGELTAATLGDFAAALSHELKERGGMLLFDGLDEVPQADQRRVQIKQAVEEFAGAHGKCRILVTSRTYAYQKQDWRLGGFAEAVLAPFGHPQIALFVDRWYAHVAALRGMHEDDAQGRAALLKQVIFASDRLGAFAERPLLLTLMASLHAWRGGSLPEKREVLYAEAVDLLLDWWQSAKVVRSPDGKVQLEQPSLAEWMKVDRDRVRSLLNELAFEAHAAQPDLVGVADVSQAAIVAGLMRINESDEVNPVRLVDYLSERAGLLLPRGGGVYAFPHRTFQEYLAACYLTDHDFPDELAARVCADPERWREVALLAAAKAAGGTPATLWMLVDTLCEGEPGEAKGLEGIAGAQIAGQALAEGLSEADQAKLNDRNRKKIARVQRWLVSAMRRQELPALERVRAGDTLGKIGDPRFRQDRWWLPDEEMLGFMEVPTGKFWMGSDPKRDKYAQVNEQPLHEVEVPAYFIGRYAVTVAQFRAFLDGSGRKPKDPDCLRGAANHPVVWVTWDEALAYADWLTETLRASPHTPARLAVLLGKQWHITLPSEAEWEKAARGTEGRIYPWGDEADPARANYHDTGIGRTSAVGCFPGGASPYGSEDMCGNVWEWTRNRRVPYPYQASSETTEAIKSKEDYRVVRGGAFDGYDGFVRCAFRYFFAAAFRDVGFRVVLSPFPPDL